MKINEAGKNLIRTCEGCRLQAYRDAVGVLTIGYGHTGDVKDGDVITQHQADVILDYDLERFEEGVSKLCPNASENEFSALVSFAFNLGLHSLEGSTLLRKFLAGDKQGAAAEFSKWVHAGGEELPGLVARRRAERDLFLTEVA